jgi:hypothetical protein
MYSLDVVSFTPGAGHVGGGGGRCSSRSVTRRRLGACPRPHPPPCSLSPESIDRCAYRGRAAHCPCCAALRRPENAAPGDPGRAVPVGGVAAVGGLRPGCVNPAGAGHVGVGMLPTTWVCTCCPATMRSVFVFVLHLGECMCASMCWREPLHTARCGRCGLCRATSACASLRMCLCSRVHMCAHPYARAWGCPLVGARAFVRAAHAFVSR